MLLCIFVSVEKPKRISRKRNIEKEKQKLSPQLVTKKDNKKPLSRRTIGKHTLQGQFFQPLAVENWLKLNR